MHTISQEQAIDVMPLEGAERADSGGTSGSMAWNA